MEYSLEGGCLCGDVRYQITKAPLDTGICHCVSCRRAVGAESVAWTVCSTSAFKFTLATPGAYSSSRGVTRTFCLRCGTSLTYQVNSESIDVALATLDDPEKLTPTKEIWAESRISWNALNGNIPVHMRGSQ
jgi:hypothetical protein